ncbi:hypothetical protein [Burkholderia ambifaria]
MQRFSLETTDARHALVPRADDSLLQRFSSNWAFKNSASSCLPLARLVSFTAGIPHAEKWIGKIRRVFVNQWRHHSKSIRSGSKPFHSSIAMRAAIIAS